MRELIRFFLTAGSNWFMGLVILFALLVCVVIFTSCATAPPLPPENIVISAPTPCGRIYVRIIKGILNEEYRGKFWIREEDFMKLKGMMLKPLEEGI